MPFLQPLILPTAGVPQPVVAPTRQRKTMVNPAFYQQDRGPSQQDILKMLPGQQQQMQQVVTQTERPVEQFANQTGTGDNVREQIEKIKGRVAPPQLDPGARVRIANMDMVAPSNFQKFYESLNLIDDIGKQQLATAQAQSSYKRQQAMQNILNQGPPAFNGGGGGVQTGVMPAPGNVSQTQSIVKNMAAQMGWTGAEWDALYGLVQRESGWNPSAANPSSAARGLFQKMINMHGPIESTVEGQAKWGLNYIKQRYGSPSRALQHWLSRVPINGKDVGHWY